MWLSVPGNIMGITVESWHDGRLWYDYALTGMISYSIFYCLGAASVSSPVAVSDGSNRLQVWACRRSDGGGPVAETERWSNTALYKTASWSAVKYAALFQISLERLGAGTFCHCVMVHRNNWLLSCVFFSFQVPSDVLCVVRGSTVQTLSFLLKAL